VGSGRVGVAAPPYRLPNGRFRAVNRVALADMIHEDRAGLVILRSWQAMNSLSMNPLSRPNMHRSVPTRDYRKGRINPLILLRVP
jgi:hypothetical protein